MIENSIVNYIRDNMDKCTRYCPEDCGTLVGMPYPYTTPSTYHFEELYYWDTYFTNFALSALDKWDVVKNNTDDILFMVDKYGYMGNSNRTWHLNHSQPPFLSIMVRDVYEHYKDPVWLRGAYFVLCKEYDFWMTKRSTDIGLNHYDCDLSGMDIKYNAADYKRRIKRDLDLPDEQLARHYLSTCESGWDCNPRFDYEAFNFAPIDLNSLMWKFEKNMAFFAIELGNGEENIWEERALKRKNAIFKYMDKDGILVDYNYISGKQSEILSCASLFPMFLGLADEQHAKAMAKNVDRLIEEYGLAACAKNDAPEDYQWNYPIGWPCQQYVAAKAMMNYGYKEIALKIANKYIRLIEKIFNETGNFWEKYNVVEGSLNVTRKEKMPTMIGWTAGCYMALKQFADDGII